MSMKNIVGHIANKGSVFLVSLVVKTFKTVLVGIVDSISTNTIKMFNKQISSLYNNNSNNDEETCPNCGFNINKNDDDNKSLIGEDAKTNNEEI